MSLDIDLGIQLWIKEKRKELEQKSRMETCGYCTVNIEDTEGLSDEEIEIIDVECTKLLINNLTEEACIGCPSYRMVYVG